MNGYKPHGSHEEEMNESGVIQVNYNIMPDTSGMNAEDKASLARGVEGFGYATPQMPVTHSSKPNTGE